MAAPSSLLLWLVVRRGYTRASGMLGATIGAISGLLGASVLQFHCDRLDAVHLFVWHGGVVILSVLLGAAINGTIKTLLPEPKERYGRL